TGSLLGRPQRLHFPVTRRLHSLSDQTPDPAAPVPSPEVPEVSDSPEEPQSTEIAYIPRQVVEDDLGGMSLEEAYAASMVEVEDGQIVEGTVVKVDRDEVLLDIGYKSEGVIPARELSIRNDVDPSEIVSLGDQTEADRKSTRLNSSHRTT